MGRSGGAAWLSMVQGGQNVCQPIRSENRYSSSHLATIPPNGVRCGRLGGCGPLVLGSYVPLPVHSAVPECSKSLITQCVVPTVQILPAPHD